MGRDALLFKWAPFIIMFAIAVASGYESLAHRYMPEISILANLHSHGIFTEQPILYKPSKSIWRYMGWVGSTMMLLLMVYSLRKRIWFLRSLGPLKHWLRGHIFLGLMGPILITFHSTFKFQGLVAASFWAMIVTMCFGILGRYIYTQIPRSISGAELKENEINSMVEELDTALAEHLPGKPIKPLMDMITLPGEEVRGMGPLKGLGYCIKNDLKNYLAISRMKNRLGKEYGLSRKIRRETVALFKKKAGLIRRRHLLTTSHELLHYWHVVHIPLAILMFTVMFIHIAVYFLFRTSA